MQKYLQNSIFTKCTEDTILYLLNTL